MEKYMLIFVLLSSNNIQSRDIDIPLTAAVIAGGAVTLGAGYYAWKKLPSLSNENTKIGKTVVCIKNTVFSIVAYPCVLALGAISGCSVYFFLNPKALKDDKNEEDGPSRPQYK